jgi:hypothetical protein
MSYIQQFLGRYALGSMVRYSLAFFIGKTFWNKNKLSMDKKTVFVRKKIVFSRNLFKNPLVLTSTSARHEKTEVWGKRNQTNFKRSRNLEPKTKNVLDHFQPFFVEHILNYSLGFHSNQFSFVNFV